MTKRNLSKLRKPVKDGIPWAMSIMAYRREVVDRPSIRKVDERARRRTRGRKYRDALTSAATDVAVLEYHNNE